MEYRLTKEESKRIKAISANPLFLKFCDTYKFISRATIMEQVAMNWGVFTQSVNKELTETPFNYQMYELATFMNELSTHARLVAEDIELRLIAGEYSPMLEHAETKTLQTDVIVPPSDLADMAAFEASIQRCRYMCIEPYDGYFNSLVNGLLMVKTSWNLGKPVPVYIAKETTAKKYESPYPDWINERQQRRRRIKAKAAIDAGHEEYFANTVGKWKGT